MEPLKVTLNDDDSAQLRREVFAVMSEAVQQVREKAIQAPEWLRGKKAVANYLSVGTDAVTNMVSWDCRNIIQKHPRILFSLRSRKLTIFF